MAVKYSTEIDGEEYGDPEHFKPALKHYVKRMMEIHGVEPLDVAEDLDEVSSEVVRETLSEDNHSLEEYGVDD